MDIDPPCRLKGNMQISHKPNQYNTVSPYLIVNGAEATIKFLDRVFGATVLRKIPGKLGRIVHAEVRIDDTVIMLAEAMPPEWPAVDAHVHIYVPNVDETYQKALAAGAMSVQEPVKKEDADKRGAVQDAGGTTWWIATKVE